jgi:hypothetical protein
MGDCRSTLLGCWWLCTRCTTTHTHVVPNVHRLTFTVSRQATNPSTVPSNNLAFTSVFLRVRCFVRKYCRTRGISYHKAHGFKPFCEKISSYVRRILLFLFYSYRKSHLDNNSCLPIYKTIPAICNTPHKTRACGIPFFRTCHCDFSDYMCCGPSCGL